MGLKLRKILKEDLMLIAIWRMSEEVTKYMYTDPILNYETQLKWLKNIEANPFARYWVISYDDKPIGVLSITSIDMINKRCSWAYYIGDTSLRGKGIGKILECNIYDYVFEVLNLNKLCCEVLEFNEKVIEIHKKYGSEVEGVLKEHIIKNGKPHNVVVMGITKDKWKAIKDLYSYETIEIQ
ncbi:UDP-4-amino-4,6-dideoxy-N-acetyl-beta-L-altrosamine N-acetyltransferase [Clostridium sp. Marseille-Q7071]